MKNKQLKTYEVTGVVTYADVFTKEVSAHSAKEAKHIVQTMDLNDPAMAELQEVLVDAPRLVRSPKPSKQKSQASKRKR